MRRGAEWTITFVISLYEKGSREREDGSYCKPLILLKGLKTQGSQDDYFVVLFSGARALRSAKNAFHC